MKNIIYLLIPALMLVMSSFSGCGSTDPERPNYTLTDEPAYVISGCFDLFQRSDTFSIVLDNYPQEIFLVYPAEPIPDEFRTDSMRVLISGEIMSNDLDVNQCFISPNVKLLPECKINITNIKNAEL
jgi:hypothetical protein